MAVMAALNLLDESRLNAPVAVLGYWGLWMVLPCALRALQVHATHRPLHGFGRALLILLLLMQIFLLESYTHFAMNGDTADRDAAEAMHLFLVPLLTITLAVMAFGACLVGVRVLAWRAQR